MKVQTVFTNPYVVLLSRYVVGFVFVVASLEKISNPESFASAVELYRLLPVAVINLFALVVPWIELLCGIFLVAGVFVRASSYLLACLTMVFIGAIVVAIVRHFNIDCGCFGSDHSTPVGWLKVLEDLGLLALSLHVFYSPRSALAMENRTLPNAGG